MSNSTLMEPASTSATAALLPVNVINSNWSVNWNGYADGAYTANNAHTDFGNISGWMSDRAMAYNGALRVKLLKNALSSEGGLISNIHISEGAAYKLDYYVKFHSQFDWGRGGKVGFGFLIGDGNTGGNPAWDGNGGSLRLIWYKTDAGRVVFRPYLYYKDQPGKTGDDFDLSWPASGSISKGTWYHVHIYIKSNTGSNANGRVQMLINDTVLLDKYIRWTTNDSKRLIRQICFDTFRGGDTVDWESPVNGYVDYDNLRVQKISD